MEFSFFICKNGDYNTSPYPIDIFARITKVTTCENIEQFLLQMVIYFRRWLGILCGMLTEASNHFSCPEQSSCVPTFSYPPHKLYSLHLPALTVLRKKSRTLLLWGFTPWEPPLHSYTQCWVSLQTININFSSKSNFFLDVTVLVMMFISLKTGALVTTDEPAH